MTKREIFDKLQRGLITPEQAEELLEEGKTLSCAVAAKSGGLSVYGLNRFPLTLYKNQWKKLAAFMPELLAYLEAHDSELKSKKPKDE